MMNVCIFISHYFVVNLLLHFDTALCFKGEDVVGWQRTVDVTKSDRVVVTVKNALDVTQSTGHASIASNEFEQTFPPTLEWNLIPLGSFGIKFAADKNFAPTPYDFRNVSYACFDYLLDAFVQYLDNDGNPDTPIVTAWGGGRMQNEYFLANATDQYTLFVEFLDADFQLAWPKEYLPSYNDLFGVMLASITPEFILDTVQPAAPGSPFEYVNEASFYLIEAPETIPPTASPSVFENTPEPTGVITDKPVKSSKPRRRIRNNHNDNNNK